MTSSLRVSILGGSGYAAGETLRLLLQHPGVDISQVASASRAGAYVYSVHPNLRAQTMLQFCTLDDLRECDVLFVCLPHGTSGACMRRLRELASRVIDLSADFRLRSAELYQHWYGSSHADADLLGEAVYGLPELHRDTLVDASLMSGTGCMATATILALAPVYRAGIVDEDMPVVIDAKMGSSGAGAQPGSSSHHPDRSGAVRSFAPTGHRHSAEVIQELSFVLGRPLHQRVAFSATAIELVRGVLITAQIFVNQDVDAKSLWRLFRNAYQTERFVRLVTENSGVYRYPEPKILAGSNFCDIGFAADVAQRRIVVIAALDNLMKGAAGNAVQAMNCSLGWDEGLGLSFAGLHPV